MAGNARYRLSPRAEADLEGIWLYTKQRWSITQADSYIGKFLQAFSDLATSKRTGQKCDVREGYFKIPVGAHVIYYRQPKDAIEVVRVLHARMDVNRHL